MRTILGEYNKLTLSKFYLEIYRSDIKKMNKHNYSTFSSNFVCLFPSDINKMNNKFSKYCKIILISDTILAVFNTIRQTALYIGSTIKNG